MIYPAKGAQETIRKLAAAGLKLSAFAAASLTLLLVFAAADQFLFADNWNGWTRILVYAGSFALPAFVFALLFDDWWIGPAGAFCFLVALLIPTLLTADAAQFRESWLPRGAQDWRVVSPFLSPIWGSLAGILVGRLIGPKGATPAH